MLKKFHPVLILLLTTALHAGYWESIHQSPGPVRPIKDFSTGSYPSLKHVKVLETREVAGTGPRRGVVLWMRNAQSYSQTEPYESCPQREACSGSQGVIGVALLDLEQGRQLGSLTLGQGMLQGRCPAAGYYRVEGPKNHLEEQRTVLLNPVPFDGDPNDEVYALEEEDDGGCFCPPIWVYGYSRLQDKLFQVSLSLSEKGPDGMKSSRTANLFDLFFIANRKPGQERYEFWTSVGHGAEDIELESYHYFKYQHRFEGVRESVPEEGSPYIAKGAHSGFLGASAPDLSPEGHERLQALWSKRKMNP